MPQIFKPQPGSSKGTHEAPTTRYQKLPTPQINVPIIPIGHEMRAYPGPVYDKQQDPHWIDVHEETVPQPNLIGMTTRMQQLLMCFALAHLQTKRAVSYTMISPDHSHLCRWKEAYASLYYIITNPIAYLLPQ